MAQDWPLQNSPPSSTQVDPHSSSSPPRASPQPCPSCVLSFITFPILIRVKENKSKYLEEKRAPSVCRVTCRASLLLISDSVTEPVSKALWPHRLYSPCSLTLSGLSLWSLTFLNRLTSQVLIPGVCQSCRRSCTLFLRNVCPFPSAEQNSPLCIPEALPHLDSSLPCV